jgi:type VI secretion system protein ImpA
MASPAVLDFDKLLQPISGENPAGRPLREDYSPKSVYQAVKGARTAARTAERTLSREENKPTGNLNDWVPVLEAGQRILAEESKDLEIAAWLTEALVRKHGYAGLRDGFRLLLSLVEQFWEHLYPLPDEEGMITRVASLTGLNGEEGDGVLIAPIYNVPLTREGEPRSLSIADYKQALDLDKLTDPEKKSQRIAQGAITLAMLEKAVRETPAERFLQIVEDLAACREEFDRLCTVLEEKCGRGPDGYPAAPPSSNIRGALEAVHDGLRQILKYHPDPSILAGTSDGKEAGTLVPAEGRKHLSPHVQTREDAFHALLQVAEFFKHTEPHSPVSYALEQAVRWGKMPLPELWSELVPDEAVRQQLFKLVGISQPEAHP